MNGAPAVLGYDADGQQIHAGDRVTIVPAWLEPLRRKGFPESFIAVRYSSKRPGHVVTSLRSTGGDRRVTVSTELLRRLPSPRPPVGSWSAITASTGWRPAETEGRA